MHRGGHGSGAAPRDISRWHRSKTFTPLTGFRHHRLHAAVRADVHQHSSMMLDLGGVPLLAAERSAGDPLVIAGGPCAFNPNRWPIFSTPLCLGDGEEVIHELCDTVLAWDGRDRHALLKALATLRGVYVPALFAPGYDGERTTPFRAADCSRGTSVSKSVSSATSTASRCSGRTSFRRWTSSTTVPVLR